MFDGVLGHSAQKRYLETVHKKEAFSHAYLFSGPARVGKRLIAERLGEKLLEIEPGSLGHQVDAVFIDLPLDEKTGEQKGAISVEQIRELRERLQLSSFGGKKKVAIIDHADAMTTAAQNALLKTLEEPRDGTIIFLIAESPDRLLDTIISRSVHLRFARVEREAMCALFQERGMSQEKSHALAGLAAGRPGEAMALLDKDYQEEVIARHREIAEQLSHSRAAQFAHIQSLVKSEDRQGLMRSMEDWQQVLHDALLSSAGATAHVSKEMIVDASPQHWAKTLKALSASKNAMARNVSPQLAFEHFMLHV